MLNRREMLVATGASLAFPTLAAAKPKQQDVQFNRCGAGDVN